jgi:hypothetical protein
MKVHWCKAYVDPIIHSTRRCRAFINWKRARWYCVLAEDHTTGHDFFEKEIPKKKVSTQERKEKE